MSKFKKSVERLLMMPADFTYDEAKTILTHLGFIENTKGKTSGSRVEFYKDEDTVLLHKPHPTGELKKYQLKQLIETLKELKLI